jgi:O-antigen ligase
VRVSTLGPRVDAGGAVPAAGGFALLAAIGGALGLALYAQPLSLPLVLVGGIGLVGMLALSLVRYDVAVALGVALLAVVRVEPAPVDAAFAVIIMVAAVTGRMRLDRVPLSMAALAGAFITLNVVSMMDAVDSTRAVKFISITVYLLAFGLWTCVYVDRESRARRILRVYVGVAVASALFATLALRVHFPGSQFLVTDDGERGMGLFKDPNVYGPFLVPAALMLLEEALRPKLLGPGRMLKRIGFLILVIGIVFSYSRAAALNLGVGVLVMLVVLTLRRGAGRRAFALFAIVLAVVTAVSWAVIATGSLQFLQERARFQTYDTQRFGAQRTGIELAQEHPLGIGPGQFEVLSPVSAHSTYIRALAEEGILGAVVLFALMFGVLLLAVRNAVAGRSTYGIGSTALLASWCGALANSVFVDTLHWRHLWLIAGLIWAAAMAPAGGAQASSTAAGRGAAR